MKIQQNVVLIRSNSFNTGITNDQSMKLVSETWKCKKQAGVYNKRKNTKFFTTFTMVKDKKQRNKREIGRTL